MRSDGQNDRIMATQSQLGVFLASQREKKGESYNLPCLWSLTDTVDLSRLIIAVTQTVNAHPSLKNRFVLGDDGNLYLEDRTDEEFAITVEKAASKAEVLDSILSEDDRCTRQVRPFDILRERLFRIRVFCTDEGNYLYTDFHHIIFDGLSSRLFFKQIEEAYDGKVPKQETWSMADVSKEEKSLRESGTFDEEFNWYKENFTVEDFSRMPGSFSGDQNGKEPEDFRKLSYPMSVDLKLVDEFCTKEGIGKNALFQTAFGYVLSEYDHTGEASFVSGFHGRTQDKENDTVAMMVRTLPVKITYEKGQTVSELLKNVQELNKGARKRRSVSLIDLNKALGWTGEINFVYQSEAANVEMTLSHEAQKGEDLRAHEPGLVFTMEVLHVGNGYKAHVSWPGNLLKEEFIKNFIKQVDRVTEELCRVRLIDEIELLTDDEKDEMVHASKGESLDMDITKTVTDLICEQAEKTPDNLAISDGSAEVIYSELIHRGDVLANALIKAGVKENDFVAVLLDRSVLFPIAVMGIHKAGAAYLPLDPEYPADRLEHMLRDSNAEIIVTDHLTYDNRKGEDVGLTDKTLFLDELNWNMDVTGVNLSKPDGLAYMIYTSGSTGTPKGVMLHHAGLLNQVIGLVHILDLNENDRVGSHFSFSFDAHTRDIYAVLTVGGSLHIMQSQIRKDMGAVEEFMKEHKLTDIGFTTNLGVILLNQCEYLPKRISLGGEALTGVTADKAEIYNMYGPTECTNGNLWYRLEKGRKYSSVPVGHAVPNMWGFVTDRFGHLVPDGIPGELCMAGVQVGNGYLNLPEKTDEVFLDCPFVKTDDKGRHVRMYKTGDLVYRNPEGELVCCGRIDAQVKLHGYRIELGEIESTASSLPGVEECAAAVVPVGKIRHLCLYYSSKEKTPPTADQMRNMLQETSLAAYMIPDSYKFMEELPRTPSGKIDRKNLPLPDVSETSKEIIKPRTLSERRLFDCVSKILGTDDFGVTSDLIELGLTSLDAIAVSAEAQKLEVLVKAMDLLKLRTIENVLNNRKSVCQWFEGEFKPDKPVLVVLYGLNSVGRMGKLIAKLAEEFSILTIENILDHHRFIFIDENISDMAAFYCEMIDYFLPEDKRIFGVFGHSLGGEVAYHVAAYWNNNFRPKDRENPPHVYMLDTFIKHTTKEEADMKVKEFREMKIGDDVDKKSEQYRNYLEGRQFADVIIGTSGIVPLPPYKGDVTLFSIGMGPETVALMPPEFREEYNRVGMNPNEYAWKQIHEDLIVVPVEGTHNDLQDEKYAPVYLKVLKEDMADDK